MPILIRQANNVYLVPEVDDDNHKVVLTQTVVDPKVEPLTTGDTPDK